MGCDVKNDWCKIRKKYQPLTSTYLLKKGLRGGISYIAKRYVKANDKYLNDYDPKKMSAFLTYLDMNNLQG